MLRQGSASISLSSRLLNLAPVLVLEAIWIWIWICPLAVMRTARRDCNPVTECDCVRSYAAPDPPYCTFKWEVAALAGTAQNC